MRKLTPCEVIHIRTALAHYRELIESYPELVTNRIEERLLIAEEIINHEDSMS